MTLETTNFLLGAGTLALQVGTLVLLAIYLARKRNPLFQPFVDAIGKNGLWIALLLNVAALLGSLYYSEILGIAPCGLCWVQRVFMYPQVVLFAVAFCKKDRGIAIYSIWLSAIGAVVALYQHYLQTGGEQLLPCPAAATAGVDCARRIIFEFGYITFPLVAFSVFAFLIVLMLYTKKSNK